jgi:hypothetical protein
VINESASQNCEEKSRYEMQVLMNDLQLGYSMYRCGCQHLLPRHWLAFKMRRGVRKEVPAHGQTPNKNTTEFQNGIKL